MKNFNRPVTATLAVLLMLLALAVRADDAKMPKPKPYPLETCLVCGMKLGEMGQPFAFVYHGQEIKLCDESEKAAFGKNPEKFLKKLAAATAKLKK